jgi:hypothetical protein
MDVQEGLINSVVIALLGGLAGMVLFETYGMLIIYVSIAGSVIMFMVGFSYTMMEISNNLARNVELMEFFTDKIEEEEEK